MTIPINALITTLRGFSLSVRMCVCVCVCARPAVLCDVRLVQALHRWVYLAARRACNLPTFIHLSPLLSLFLPVWCFVPLIEASVADGGGLQSFSVCFCSTLTNGPVICHLYVHHIHVKQQHQRKTF